MDCDEGVRLIAGDFVDVGNCDGFLRRLDGREELLVTNGFLRIGDDIFLMV